MLAGDVELKGDGACKSLDGFCNTSPSEKNIQTNFQRVCQWQQRRFRETYLKEAQSVPAFQASIRSLPLNCQTARSIWERCTSTNTERLTLSKTPEHLTSRRLFGAFRIHWRDQYERDQEKGSSAKVSGHAVSGDTHEVCSFMANQLHQQERWWKASKVIMVKPYGLKPSHRNASRTARLPVKILQDWWGSADNISDQGTS